MDSTNDITVVKTLAIRNTAEEKIVEWRLSHKDEIDLKVAKVPQEQAEIRDFIKVSPKTSLFSLSLFPPSLEPAFLVSESLPEQRISRLSSTTFTPSSSNALVAVVVVVRAYQTANNPAPYFSSEFTGEEEDHVCR